MIAGSSSKGFFAAHWDWLVAALGAMALVAAASVAVMEFGADPDEAKADALSSLGRIPFKAGAIEPVDMAKFDEALEAYTNPPRVPEPEAPDSPETATGDFLSSDFRVYCEQGDPNDEKRSCGLPIPFGKTVCPICGAKQPEEAKIELDTDGDGFSDEWEKAHGLDPEKDDRDLDLDSDGFTNLEEFEAGTDPNDPTDHPSYLDSLSIKLPLIETYLPFYFDKVAELPGGKYRYYFRDPSKKSGYGAKGITYSVLEGEEIGAAEAVSGKNPKLATGYVVKGYEKKSERRKISAGKGDKALEREVDVSVATIERKSDSKRLALTVGASKTKVAVDSKAVLVYTRGETKEFQVVQGDKIVLNGTEYRIAAIWTEGHTVKVAVEQSMPGEKKDKKTLEAKAQ